MTIAPIAYGSMIVLAVNSEDKADMAGTKAMAGVRTAILVTLTMISAVALEGDHVSIGADAVNGFRLDAASAADAAAAVVIV